MSAATCSVSPCDTIIGIFDYIYFLTLGPHRSSYQSLGSVACRNCTLSFPLSQSASSANAAFVRSTCLEFTAHPAHVSTMRTNTQRLGVLHTELAVSVKHLLCQIGRHTLDKFEAFRFIVPPMLSEGRHKRIVSGCPFAVRPTTWVLQVVPGIPESVQ